MEDFWAQGISAKILMAAGGGGGMNYLELVESERC